MDSSASPVSTLGAGPTETTAAARMDGAGAFLACCPERATVVLPPSDAPPSTSSPRCPSYGNATLRFNRTDAPVFVLVEAAPWACTYAGHAAAAAAAGIDGVLFYPAANVSASTVGPAGAWLPQPTCFDTSDCARDPGTVAGTVVSRATADALRRAIARAPVHAGTQVANVTVRFDRTDAPPLAFVVDRRGRLGEAGHYSRASLVHSAWAAQWLGYQARTEEALDAVVHADAEDVNVIFESAEQERREVNRRSATNARTGARSGSTASEVVVTVPVFDGGEPTRAGRLSASVRLPPRLAEARRVEVDFSLDCVNGTDFGCPRWDHVVQLHACCRGDAGEACEPARGLSWAAGDAAGVGAAVRVPEVPSRNTNRPRHRRRAAYGADAPLGGAGSVPVHIPGPVSGWELARWITPFGRRGGRWISDVTPLHALLDPRPHGHPAGSRCRLHLSTPSWAGDWVPALSLRFHVAKPTRDGAWTPGSTPWREAVPLFSGGRLSSTYGGGRRIVALPAEPSRRRRVTLVAVISGHGQEERFDCGEFCETLHVFRVNGRTNVTAELGFAGGTNRSEDGCAGSVSSGVQPNQFGTWEFARGGWCNASPVRLWTFDVTEAVNGGEDLREGGRATASVEYFASVKGHDGIPRLGALAPNAGPPSILMESYMVFTSA